MERLVAYVALLTLLGVASSTPWTDVAPVPTLHVHMHRHLQQPQCTCAKPNFSCANSTVFCQAGTVITNPQGAAGCTFVPNPSDCIRKTPDNVVPVGPATVTCPTHAGTPVTATYCMDGISILGGSPAPCKVCHTITFVGSCDAPGAASGRSNIACFFPKLTCRSVGQVLSVATFGCTVSTPAGCRGLTPGFFYNASVLDNVYTAPGALLPTKITCTPAMVAGSVTCGYRVSGLPCTQCLNKVAATIVVVGPGTPPIIGLRNPAGCATPAP